ncbi:FUSC family protein [Desulfovibrio inopinatus]|uniref:FUSC family protein n=1 Tax=Desulfovibrio inopinatus TaxID=102109 RepID=UPI00146FBF42|nr:FUSC family protein [Desulfovibrio inopinatus]
MTYISNTRFMMSLSRFFRTMHWHHAVKTAVAGLFTWFVTQGLHLDQGYWAILTAIIVMQSNVGGSLKAGWIRFLGTTVGATVGAACALFLGHGGWPLFVSMLITMLICSNVTLLRDSVRVAALTAVIILFVSDNANQHPLYLALMRFIEISLGIATALIVSFFVFPAKARTLLRPGIAHTLRKSAQLFDLLCEFRQMELYRPGELFHLKDEVVRSMMKNYDLLAEARREPGYDREAEIFSSFLRAQDRIYESILTMDHAVHAIEPDQPHVELVDELSQMAGTVSDEMRQLADCLDKSQCAPDSDRLIAAMQAMDTRLDSMRSERVFATFSRNEVLQFFSFLHAVQETAREVSSLALRTGTLEGRSTQRNASCSWSARLQHKSLRRTKQDGTTNRETNDHQPKGQRV